MSVNAATAAPVVSSTESIRNVVLVGPSGAGKSRLFDHLVSELVPGRSPVRETHDRSPGLRAASVVSDGMVITLLDAPGNPDFVGDVRAGLRAADAALFIVSAADGVDAATRALWHECQVVGMPRAVAISQLDARDADFLATLQDCQNHFGQGVQESEDDSLMDRYLEGEELEFATLESDLLKAVAHGAFHPVLPVSAENGAGVEVLLHMIKAAFPHPGLHPLPTVTPVEGGEPVAMSADPNGPLVAEVVHTQSDAYVGHLSLVRVFSGTLRADRAVHVSGHMEKLGILLGEGHAPHDEDVRPGAIAAPLDGDLRTKPSAIAGEVVVVTKLGTAQTSDTISDPDRPLLVTPWQLPEALLPAAVEAATRADEDKMPNAFHELAAEDPTLRIEHVRETAQIVLWTTGPTHLDLVLARLKSRYNVDVKRVDVKVSMRETAIVRAQAQGRHVKQSGGHGQFAVVQMSMEPATRGEGNSFHEVVVGGAVPRQFIGSVEKGTHMQLEKGLLAGWPVVDVKVTLHDGKAHSVDSSDMAFQTAAGLALREMASANSMCLLEPIDLVNVTVDDEYLGAIMTDVSTRRGQIVGSAPAEGEEGRSVLTATIPQLELIDYAIALRSLAHGTGTFARELHGYEMLPQRLTAEHIAKAHR